MKQLRLVAYVLAAAAWSLAASACDMHKGATASAAAAGAKGGCPYHAGASATAANAPAECPAGMSAQCTAAMRAQCQKGTATAAAMPAGCAKGAAAAAFHGTSATTAVMRGTACCSGQANATAANSRCDTKAMHADCSVCLDEATCDNALRSAGVREQVVALRNGAMIVYTAETPAGVRSLQNTVARYNDHIMSAYLASTGQSSLCAECRAFRGAMASGKFSRELVNVRNGCQILLTSSDRNIVAKIHDMSGPPMAARVAARVRS